MPKRLMFTIFSVMTMILALGCTESDFGDEGGGSDDCPDNFVRDGDACVPSGDGDGDGDSDCSAGERSCGSGSNHFCIDNAFDCSGNLIDTGDCASGERDCGSFCIDNAYTCNGDPVGGGNNGDPLSGTLYVVVESTQGGAVDYLALNGETVEGANDGFGDWSIDEPLADEANASSVDYQEPVSNLYYFRLNSVSEDNGSERYLCEGYRSPSGQTQGGGPRLTADVAAYVGSVELDVDVISVTWNEGSVTKRGCSAVACPPGIVAPTHLDLR